MAKKASYPMRERGLLYSTAILGAGTAVVKLLGALFKIPLTNLLGGVGIASFNVAYEIYLPLYALFVSGIPAAVSRQVSESMACARLRDAKRLLPLSLCFFGLMGCAGAFGMFLGAKTLASFVQNPAALPAIRALSPALFFGSITACFRGYRQGLSDMLPTALSQSVEALGKLLLGLGLSWAMLLWCQQQYAQTGSLLGVSYDSAADAAIAALPLCAAAAILGITLSSFVSMVFLCLFNRLRPGISPQLMAYTQPSSPKRLLLKRLLHTAIPICLTSVIANITSFVDLTSVMSRLNTIVSENESFLRQMYNGSIPPEADTSHLAAYLYGSYSGLALPLFNLIPTLTGVLAASLLPIVCRAWVRGGQEEFTQLIRSSILWSAVISFPAGMGLFFLAEPILHLLYPGRPMEAAVITQSLALMGLGAMPVGVTLTVNTALQGAGKAKLPMKLTLAGGVIKLLCNYFLVAKPHLNIHGAPVGTIFCYLFILTFGLYALSDVCSDLSLPSTLGKPLLCAILCGLFAKASFHLLSLRLPHAPATILSIAWAAIVYLFFLILTKTITKKDIFVLFSSKKFENLLAKVHVLG